MKPDNSPFKNVKIHPLFPEAKDLLYFHNPSEVALKYFRKQLLPIYYLTKKTHFCSFKS